MRAGAEETPRAVRQGAARFVRYDRRAAQDGAVGVETARRQADFSLMKELNA